MRFAGEFKLDPALENAFAEQKAFEVGGAMSGEGGYQAAVPPMVTIQLLKDFLGRRTGQGTLDDAYIQGMPGVARPTTPDTVRPSDSNIDFMDIYTL
tara:strand:- start:5254 stop:5544 length:291 start_codon:yes stop_codon:yes gene_type:complete